MGQSGEHHAQETQTARTLITVAFSWAFAKSGDERPRMMLSRIFGDKSRFAVEVQHSPTASGPDNVFGLHFYWVDGRRIGRDEFRNLTDTLTDMHDAGIHRTGHRAGGSYCALSPAEFMQWWDQNLWGRGRPDDDGRTWWDVLWERNRCFRLDFDSSNIVDDNLYLLDCDGTGRLIWRADQSSPAIVIEADINYFESILKSAYDYMCDLQEFPGYKQYLTDQQYKVPYSSETWNSTLIRLERTVEPQGREAVVDHLVLFRAPSDAFHNRISEIGRSMEREEIGEKHVVWRFDEGFYEAMSVAPASADLDGMEVYCEWPVINVEDLAHFPAGTVFHPERSTPLRQRQMSLGSQAHPSDAVPWFSVQIRMAIMVEGRGCDSFVDYVHLVRATDFDAAFDRALSIGRSKERERPCYDHPRIFFQFAEVRALTFLGVEELGDVVELRVESHPPNKAERIPFWTKFNY